MSTHFTQRITSRRLALFLLGGLTLAATVVSAVVPSTGIAAAAGIKVTNCNDSGPGSLRAVVAAATNGETVSFALSPPCSTITLTSGLIDVATSVTINGPGATVLAVSGNGSSGVFEVEPGVIATISGLTIEDGPGVGAIDNHGTLTVKNSTLSGTDGALATIVNESGATLTVTGSTLSGNDNLAVGGIENVGTATVTGSTLSDNTGDVAGGGIANAGTLTVKNSTLSGNSAPNGGGIYNTAALTVTGSTLSDNSSNGTSPGAGGGGIYNTGTVTVTNSTLSNNSARDGSGGIYAAGETVTLTKTTLSGNGESLLGGVELAGGTVTATNSNFS